MEEVAECIPDSRLEHEDIPYQMIYTQLTPIETNVPVFCPCTGIDHVKAPKVIYLDEQWRSTYGKNVTSTAEHTMGLLLRLAKKAKIQLNGKKIGIIGYGRIGQMTAKYAEAFDMKVKYCDNFTRDNKNVIDFMNSFKTLLCDVITIHVPLNEKTKGMINAKDFSVMAGDTKTLLINTARQQIINIDDLIPYLQNEEIYYADDFKNEIDLTEYGAIQTNHVAGNSIEARQLTDEYIAKKVVQYIKDMV